MGCDADWIGERSEGQIEQSVADKYLHDNEEMIYRMIRFLRVAGRAVDREILVARPYARLKLYATEAVRS